MDRKYKTLFSLYRWLLNIVSTNLFWSIVKQVLQHINHSRRLIPDGIHSHEGMREEKPFFPF